MPVVASQRAWIEVFVGRDDELVWPQPLAHNPALVQVEHDPCLGGEVRGTGKIHDRCRHGLRASSSQRHTVLTLTCSTSPQAMASSRTSAMLKRLNGTARSAGSSQAIALTSAMTTGGERPAASFGGGYTQNLRDEAPNRPSSRMSSL